MQGQQVILRAYGQPFEIQEYDVPAPGPGDIVLKITQTGICGSDLHTWRGDTEANPIPPQGRAMGHEGTGVVYKLGRGADVVMKLVGYAPLLPEGIVMLTNGGTFVEIGLYFSGQTVPFDPSTLVLTGKRIVGSA